MNERLKQLKAIIEELKGDSFGERYGIADWVDTNKAYAELSDALATECDFYRRTLNELETLIK